MEGWIINIPIRRELLAWNAGFISYCLFCFAGVLYDIAVYAVGNDELNLRHMKLPTTEQDP